MSRLLGAGSGLPTDTITPVSRSSSGSGSSRVEVTCGGATVGGSRSKPVDDAAPGAEIDGGSAGIWYVSSSCRMRSIAALDKLVRH